MEKQGKGVVHVDGIGIMGFVNREHAEQAIAGNPEWRLKGAAAGELSGKKTKSTFKDDYPLLVRER